MNNLPSPHVDTARRRVVRLRDSLVMLASDVAAVFEVEARQIVQNIKRNPDKLHEHYAFELTDDEVAELRSLGVIPKPGRGGSRSRPWALTQKGVMRLATIMNAPKALEATDIMIDVFNEVVEQVAQGETAVQVSAPSRLVKTSAVSFSTTEFGETIMSAIQDLLRHRVGGVSGSTIGDQLDDVAANAFAHLQAMLRTQTVKNAKVEAEALLILEQARDIFERRQSDLEHKSLDAFGRKIDLVERLLGLRERMEPNAIVGLLPGFSGAGDPRP